MRVASIIARERRDPLERVRPLLPVVAVIAVILAPWVAFAAGRRAESIENRTPAPAPRAKDGWHFLPNLDAYLVDRLPLRREAVAADAWVDVNVFGAAPTAGQAATGGVVLGKAGWLYLQDELDRQCNPPSDPEGAKANVDAVLTAIQRSGRNLAFAVAPDKSVVVPQYLDAGAFCSPNAGDALWQLLRRRPLPGFVDMRAVLETEQAQRRSPVYLRKDTHWNGLGAILLVRELVEEVAPGALSDSSVALTGRRSYTGDLTKLIGLPETDTEPVFALRRTGPVHVESEQAGVVTVSRATSSATDVVAGRTLYIYDSFGEIALPTVQAAFADVRAIAWFDMSPDRFVAEVARADTVLIEIAQREFTFHFGARFDWSAIVASLEQQPAEG